MEHRIGRLATPTVSVIMPAFNAEKFVAEAVSSVLSQTFRGFELIVVNDGSKDGTARILDHYDDPRIVRVEHEHNQGLVRSLNEGLGLVRGDFIARLDADDVALPTRLEEQVALLSREPDTVIVGSRCDEIDEEGAYLRTCHYPLNDTDIRWRTLFHCSFLHSAVMFRASTVRSHGLRYDTGAIYGQDYELWSRMLQYGRGVNLEQSLVKYRIHARQISQESLREQNEMGNRISRMNLKRRGLGGNASDEELAVLRNWVIHGPRLNDRRDMQLGRLLLRMLDEFAHGKDVDPVVVKDLRRLWVKRLLDAASARQAGALVSSGMLGDVLRRDYVSVFAQGSIRVARRVRRTLAEPFSGWV